MMVDVIRQVFAQYLERLSVEIRPLPWVAGVLKDWFSMVTSCHATLPSAAVKLFDVLASQSAASVRNVIAGILDWFQEHEPDGNNAGLWIKGVSMVFVASKKFQLDLTALADGVVDLLMGLLDEYQPAKQIAHCLCGMLEQLNASCSKHNHMRLRSVRDWILGLPDLAPSDKKLVQTIFPDRATQLAAVRQPKGSENLFLSSFFYLLIPPQI